MFRIGNLRGAGVETPESHTSGGADSSVAAGSCAEGGDRTCNTNAQCVDYDAGFCCQCNSPHMGNGINCIEPGTAQRVNGKVTGVVNGVDVGEGDLHAYVVTNGGRTFTAISRMPADIGYAMQALFIVGGGLGWLFAVPTIPMAQNGFMTSGGDVNRTVNVRFMGAGESLEIRQQFVGQDAQGFMRLTTQVNGNMPRIDSSAKVEVADYREDFTVFSPGTVKGSGTHSYTVDGVPYRAIVDETLTFKDCEHRPAGERTHRLGVSRNFVVFDSNEQIVRISQTNKIASIVGTDPCKDASYNCDSNADCVPHSDSYRCLCKPGYRGDGVRCEDVNECEMNTHDCNQDAVCYNNVGSYECRCLPGFRGDGRDCERDLSCADLTCDVNAQCVFDSELETPKCECHVGFSGDGITSCQAVEFSCNEADVCGRNAECVYDYDRESYECQCVDGFSGDGYSCTDTGEVETGCRNCHINAKCDYDVNRLLFTCQCDVGYTGDGHSCSLLAQSCDVTNNCDVNARCQPDDRSGRYACVCNPGYEGDGLRCDAVNYGDDCSLVNFCHRDAQCLYDYELRRYTCQCNEGFSGDGRDCREEVVTCHEVNNCDINAECVYDPRDLTYRCNCRQGYEGDGYSCRLTADCRRDPTICDTNARCERRDYDFVCICQSGYQGDGYRCASVGDARAHLLLAQGMTIVDMPFNPTPEDPGKPILMIPGQTAIGIDVDCYSRYFYWTDVAGKTISSAKLDGTDSDVIVQRLGSPEGVAVDWISKNLYWTDSGLDRIEVSRLDGNSRKTLFTEGLVNPRAIAVDPVSGVMFWTDWDREAPKIESSRMDGSDRTVLVSDNLGLPNGLVIDYDGHLVCWADAGTMQLECAKYDGRARRSIYALASYPFGLTYANNVFYWTDWDMKSLPSINKYGDETNEPIVLPPGGNGRLYGITNVRSQCPMGSNACAANNGGCRFLCLPYTNGRRTCTCPDDITEEECNRISLLE